MNTLDSVNIIKSIEDFLALDATRNFTAIIAVVIAFMGGKKVLSSYTNHRLIASASFYAPLRIYLLRLRKALLGKVVDYPFSCALFALSENLNFSGIRLDDKVLIEEKENISNLSKSFLDFLSKANNQFPDNKKKERASWRQYLEELVNYLIDIENLNRGITISKLDGVLKDNNIPSRDELIKQITKYYEELNTLITNILNFINSYEDKILKKAKCLF